MNEMLKIFTENVVCLHTKYLSDRTVKNFILYPKLEINQDILNKFSDLNAGYGYRLDGNLVEVRISQIITNTEKQFSTMSTDGLELLLFDFLDKLYNEITNMETQCQLNSILHFYFEKLTAKLPYLTKSQFETLTRYFLPYIKLKKIIENIQEGVTSSRNLVLETYECIAYPRFSREDCYQTVFNKLGNSDWDLIGYETSHLPGTMGFLGEYFNLRIIIKHKTKTRSLRFFAKLVLSTGQTWKSMSIRAFKKEEFFYKTFLSQLMRCGFEKLLSFSPNCYFTRTNDVIVLEDLTSLGFTESDIRTPVEYEWMLLTIKQLSRFHACSMLLDKKYSEEHGVQSNVGDLFKEFLHEINFEKENPDCRIVTFSSELISEYFVEKLPEICKRLSVNEFKAKAATEVENAFENLKRSNSFYNVICHGDLWGSNILSKNHKNCVFVDYQMIRYCPPVVDLLFLIYTNTDKDLRLKYMDHMVNTYYENLKENLLTYNVDINEFYTRERFLESVNYFRSTGIVQSLIYLQILLCPKDILEQIRSDVDVADSFYLVDRTDVYDVAWDYEMFKTRIRSLMEDLYSICEQN